MSKRVEIELKKCPAYGGGCWIWRHTGDEAHLFNERAIQGVPRTAAAVFAVLLKTSGANTYRISASGDVEGFGGYCDDWKRRVKLLYRRGFRAIRFEYVEG